MGRDNFIEYVHELLPDPSRVADQSFDKQAQSMLGDLDAFRDGFGTE